VQRKHSIEFAEFIAGKYFFDDGFNYLRKLIYGMTPEERQIIKRNNMILQKIWEDPEVKMTLKVNDSYFKYCESRHNKLLDLFDLATALSDTPYLRYDTEWGLPKGRKENGETDIQCARREFEEETGIPRSNLALCPVSYTEEFIGLNGKLYIYQYFLGQIINDDDIDRITHSDHEIKKLKLINIDDIQLYIHSTKRLEVIRNAFADTNPRPNVFRKINEIDVRH
jgi:8-oxo-dGTP pyrophosphatase MutT (NUDIX family)